MAVLAQQQFTIRRLIDGKTLNFLLQSNQALTQIYTPDPATFVPNWTTSNLKITPDLLVSGESGTQIARLKAAPTWKINGSTTLTTFGATAATTAPYALTINKNMADVNQLVIECSGIYVQPVSLAEMPVSATMTFTKVANNGASIIAVCTAADGVIFKNSSITSLSAECDMWRGAEIDNTNVTYRWFIKTSGNYVELTSANAATYHITGYTTRKITIPNDAVLNYATFKCTIKDTDTGSSTYNKEVTDTISFIDMSDPYDIRMDLPQGDSISVGASITAKVDVYQGATKMADAFFMGKTCRFFRNNASGVLDTTWGASGYKTGRSITITEADLLSKYQTVFGVEVNG